ncbi:MAG: Ger(x)C family spore germination protein [Deltaproteobacteria bacterium]
MNKAKFLCFIIFTALMVLLSGCWDYVEYENMAQVYGMGIDYNPESHEITVTIQSIETGTGVVGEAVGGGSSEKSKETMPKSVVHAAADFTVSDALEKLQRGIDKRLFYGYMEVIIIGKSSAQYITKDIMEVLTRTPMLRTTANLFVSKESAMDVLRTFDPFSKAPSTINIHNMLNTLGETGLAFPVSVNDFEKMMSTNGLEPVLPLISVKNLEEKKDEFTSEKGSQTVTPLELTKGHFIIDSMAVFKGDVFKGFLEAKESEGFVWLMGKTKKSAVTLNNFQGVNTKKIIILRIVASKSKIESRLVDGKLDMVIKIDAKAVLRKYVTEGGSSYITPEVINNIEEEMSRSICMQIENTLKKGQKELKTDIFGFGYALYKKYPTLWHKKYADKWYEIFPGIPVKIIVKSKVINTDTNIMKINAE